MCYIACNVCNCDLMSDGAPVSTKYGSQCCQQCEHAYEHYARLETRLEESEARASRYHEAMTEIVARAAEQLRTTDAALISVPRDLLVGIAKTLAHRGNVDRFLDCEYTRLWIAAAASRVFDPDRTEPLEKKLEWLREAVESHRESLAAEMAA